jgi:HEPN domain-containing protein
MSYERYRDWLDEAEDDISSAEIMLREGKYSKTCFFSQQAAEKALKALHIAKYKRYEETHSVSELLRRAEAPDELVRAGDHLDRFYIPTRYPNVWPSGAPFRHYREEDAKDALDTSRRVMEFVKKQIR